MKKRYVSLFFAIVSLLIYNYKNNQTPDSPSLPSSTTLTDTKPTESNTTKNIKPNLSKVVRVVDGDTVVLEINGVEEKVRLIGLNTPETVDPRRPVQCFGKEASSANKKLVEGKMVRLEKDVSETDKYGRLLRYVYVGDMFVNDYLTRNGFAYASTFPPDVKYAEQFKEAQKEARINKRGLWNGCPIKN